MEILSITKDRLNSDNYIAFISPFYAGDDIHECIIKIKSKSSLKDALDNTQKLINIGRKDINPIEFETVDQAYNYAYSIAFEDYCCHEPYLCTNCNEPCDNSLFCPKCTEKENNSHKIH